MTNGNNSSVCYVVGRARQIFTQTNNIICPCATKMTTKCFRCQHFILYCRQTKNKKKNYVTVYNNVCSLSESGTSGRLTLSTPAVPNCCCSKDSAPYWSNPSFLIFDIRALWRSVLSARAPECQKLKMMGWTSMAEYKALTALAMKGLR